MNQYKIYKHSSGTTEAIKEGWSWPAFFFTAFWAISKKMWAVGIGTFITMLVGVPFAHNVAHVILSSVTFSWLDRLLTIGLALIQHTGFTIIVYIVFLFILGKIFGAKGNSWREKNLMSREYKKSGTVTASDPSDAIAQYTKT